MSSAGASCMHQAPSAPTQHRDRCTWKPGAAARPLHWAGAWPTGAAQVTRSRRDRLWTQALPRPAQLGPLNGLIPVQAQAEADDVNASIPLHTQHSRTSSLGPRPQHASSGQQSVCACCKGRGSVTCKPCSGSGTLTRAGYNKRNIVPKDAINSKWTAMEETLGWRHFRVIQQRKQAGGLVFMRLQASCDPSAQLWVNRDALRDRSQWAAGWLQMSEMPNLKPRRREGGGDGDDDAKEGFMATAAQGPGRACHACGGQGVVVCRECDASGVKLINL